MMNSKIVFDAERMKYPHTGLYHFCLNLGKAIQRERPFNREVLFFLNKKVARCFGKKALYLQQYSLQKLLQPKSRKFDVWHSTFQLTDYLPRSSKTKVVSTIHDLNFLKEGKSPERIKFYLKKVQRVIDRSSEVVAISNYVKDDIIAHCDLQGKDVHVIYNGSNIDEDVLVKSRKQEPLESENYIYTIGTINKKKNFHILLYLLLGNNLKLVISGIIHEPDYKDSIVQLASELGVSDRVVFTGTVTEIEKYNYLQHCSIFAFPSIAEGFGLPVVEAMSLGKKVLLSKFTCLPEIGGDEAFYLDSMDEQYLENFGRYELMRLLNLPDRSHEIKQWASQFTWSTAAKKYWEVYEKLLNEN